MFQRMSVLLGVLLILCSTAEAGRRCRPRNCSPCVPTCKPAPACCGASSPATSANQGRSSNKAAASQEWKVCYYEADGQPAGSSLHDDYATASRFCSNWKALHPGTECYIGSSSEPCPDKP